MLKESKVKIFCKEFDSNNNGNDLILLQFIDKLFKFKFVFNPVIPLLLIEIISFKLFLKIKSLLEETNILYLFISFIEFPVNSKLPKIESPIISLFKILTVPSEYNDKTLLSLL